MTGYILINMRTGKPISMFSSMRTAEKKREALYKKGSKSLRIGILSGRGAWVSSARPIKPLSRRKPKRSKEKGNFFDGLRPGKFKVKPKKTNLIKKF